MRLGTGRVPFFTPLMPQAGFGCPVLIAGCADGADGFKFIIAKSTVTQVFTTFGDTGRPGRHYGIYRSG